jgi:type VI secretion system protein ImpL
MTLATGFRLIGCWSHCEASLPCNSAVRRKRNQEIRWQSTMATSALFGATQTQAGMSTGSLRTGLLQNRYRRSSGTNLFRGVASDSACRPSPTQLLRLTPSLGNSSPRKGGGTHGELPNSGDPAASARIRGATLDSHRSGRSGAPRRLRGSLALADLARTGTVAVTAIQRCCIATAHVLLASWGCGLLIVAVQLGAWRQELSGVLLQLNADARFLALVPAREAVEPEWYRRKALALLAATERLRDDATWTLFVPGSWRVFDDLEERVHGRVEQEFGEIVAETIRRELVARAGQLTGAPLGRGAAAIALGMECEAPALHAEGRAPLAGGNLPELEAVASYVASIRRLDDAFDAYLALHRSAPPAHELQRLVRYTLGKELPDSFTRTAGLFHRADEVHVNAALLKSQLQSATQCSLLKGMAALHTGLLQMNDLFRLEQELAQQSAGLFEADARTMSVGKTLDRYRNVHALLEQQRELLARGHNAWMRSGGADFGSAYSSILADVGQTRLLGPQVVHRLQQQSATAFAEFKRQFENTFGGEGDAGIMWVDAEQRFGLSPEREALRTGLAALLQVRFMADISLPRSASLLPAVAEEAESLGLAYFQFSVESLPLFPDSVRPVVARFASTRFAEFIFQQTSRAWKKGRLAESDAARFQQDREQVSRIQAVLKEIGGSYFARRLQGLVDEELLHRLDLPFEQARGEPASDARSSDFGRWTLLQYELRRYRTHGPDTSLGRVERFFAAIGDDLRRENCADRLAANMPSGGYDDRVAQGLLQIHTALAQRCTELNIMPSAPHATSAAAEPSYFTRP